MVRVRPTARFELISIGLRGEERRAGSAQLGGFATRAPWA